MSKNCTNDGCECTPNSAIRCNVTNCAHHCQDTSMCGLNIIQVGKKDQTTSANQCTDCQNFRQM